MLDELQTFNKQPKQQETPVSTATPTPHAQQHHFARLPSYPSTESVASPVKVPASTNQQAEISSGAAPAPAPPPHTAKKRVPPPPPPRTSSRSPLVSPTGSNTPVTRSTSLGPYNRTQGRVPQRTHSESSAHSRKTPVRTVAFSDEVGNLQSSNSSSSESINSQEGLSQRRGSSGSSRSGSGRNRQDYLQQRHDELIRKQKHLQEQYNRLTTVPSTSAASTSELKKTGSESNLITRMGFGMVSVDSEKFTGGSLSNLAPQNKNLESRPPSAPVTKQGEVKSRISAASVIPSTTSMMTEGSSITTAPVCSINNDAEEGGSSIMAVAVCSETVSTTSTSTVTTSKIYETDIL